MYYYLWGPVDGGWEAGEGEGSEEEAYSVPFLCMGEDDGGW